MNEQNGQEDTRGNWQTHVWSMGTTVTPLQQMVTMHLCRPRAVNCSLYRESLEYGHLCEFSIFKCRQLIQLSVPDTVRTK